MTSAPWGYDIFLSHNHVDKEWVRALADRLADCDFNGRALRPWLDQHFLDPGSLGSNDELTSAIDRSRFLGLVLSPEAVASPWVELELQHFLKSRDAASVIAMLLRDCSLPAELQRVPLIDFRNGDGAFDALLSPLAPRTEVTLADVETAVDAAFQEVEESDPGGFFAEPTPERDAFLQALLRHDIADAAGEGLAVRAFLRAAERLLGAYAEGSPAAYNLKMLLGECLAVAFHRTTRYRQVAQRYLDLAAGRPEEPPILLFVVARAMSKLAEIDSRLVDSSAVLRALSQLDAMDVNNEVGAIQILFGRVAAKLRDTPAGELLIKRLTERGRASRIAAAGAMSPSAGSGPVFYLSELQQLSGARPAAAAAPPSRRLLGELFGLDLRQDESVVRAVQNARAELQAAYPKIDLPYGLLWGIRQERIDDADTNNAPFTGTVIQVSLKNMIDQSARADVSTVAWLTEPRIVDALFDGCGALLVLEQEHDSPQLRRLRDRSVPFAALPPEAMARLQDGDHVLVDSGFLRIMKK